LGVAEEQGIVARGENDASLRPFASSWCSTDQRSALGARASRRIGDRLDISEAGQIAGRLAEIPEIRADRVAQLRESILNGTYETEERLSTAVDRLLDEIA
jgi:anti-sigma28 factor (negative regulator of flagellin synthesis)